MAEKTEIFDAIEALAVHCRPPLMTVEQRTLWMRDWGQDLAEFPLDAITAACRKWRHSGATKFPTAGQLVPLIRDSLPTERGPRIEVWREPTEDEYRAMTVREKIRHHLIMAHEAGARAGPMFRNTTKGARASGDHIEADDMPDSWRRWKAEEARHLERVKALRDVVRQPMAAAE